MTEEMVVAHTAKSPFEAQVLAAVLAEAGIPVYVGSQMLTDEFAMSQLLAGVSSVDLRVRSEDVERARAAIAASSESKDLLEAEDFDPGERVD